MSETENGAPDDANQRRDPTGEGRTALNAVTEQLRGFENRTYTLRRRSADVTLGRLGGQAWRVTCGHAQTSSTQETPHPPTGSITVNPTVGRVSSDPEALEWLEYAAWTANHSRDAITFANYAGVLLDTAPSSIPIRESSETILYGLAFLAGYSFTTVWRTVNQAYRENRLNDGFPVITLELTLRNNAIGEVCHYQQYDGGGETLVFESRNNDLRSTMAAIGYAVYQTGDWEPPQRADLARNLPAPPDAALGHFANRIAQMLNEPWA